MLQNAGHRLTPCTNESVQQGVCTHKIMTNSIYIIIPVHNRKEFTRNCLYSLERQTRPCHQIIVVDDGSTDGTSEMLAKEFPGVIVLSGDGSLFWTAAINLGVRLALTLGAEYVLTLNNDTV